MLFGEPPHGDERVADLRERLAEMRSILVVRRFAWKLGIFVCVSLAYSGTGGGLFKHLAAFALLSTTLAIMLGNWRKDQVDAPHFTYFDEAAWFMLVSIAADRQA